MIAELFPNLYIGDLMACTRNLMVERAVVNGMITHPALIRPHATVHCCKHPCHVQALGYLQHVPKDDPHYLTYEVGPHMYLNMIDPELPLFSSVLFISAYEFIAKHIDRQPVVVHCNGGMSRAPSVAMVYLARSGKIPRAYGLAQQWVGNRYEFFNQGRGIDRYLRDNWDELVPHDA